MKSTYYYVFILFLVLCCEIKWVLETFERNLRTYRYLICLVFRLWGDPVDDPVDDPIYIGRSTQIIKCNIRKGRDSHCH